MFFIRIGQKINSIQKNLLFKIYSLKIYYPTLLYIGINSKLIQTNFNKLYWILSKTLKTIDLITFMNRAPIFKIWLLYSTPGSYYSTACLSKIFMSMFFRTFIANSSYMFHNIYIFISHRIVMTLNVICYLLLRFILTFGSNLKLIIFFTWLGLFCRCCRTWCMEWLYASWSVV